MLAIAGGICYAVIQMNKPTGWEAAKDEKLVTPANTTGKDGTTILIGEARAKKTLDVYEDPRCPVCAQFEQAVGKTLNKDVDDGKYKMKFIGATSSTATCSGEGSKNAISALGAALNVSKEAFLDYKTRCTRRSSTPRSPTTSSRTTTTSSRSPTPSPR